MSKDVKIDDFSGENNDAKNYKNENTNKHIDEEGSKEDVVNNANQEIDQISNMKSTIARLQADFSNYKKRTERERRQSIELANEDLIIKLLPVLDDLERAIDSAEKDDEFVKGIEFVYGNLFETLKNEGLELISLEGEFDPNYHHAVLTEEFDGLESGHILDTLQKGYILNNKVIRPAMVKVSK